MSIMKLPVTLAGMQEAARELALVKQQESKLEVDVQVDGGGAAARLGACPDWLHWCYPACWFGWPPEAPAGTRWRHQLSSAGCR